MAVPQKVTLNLSAKDGKLTIRLKHRQRGILRECSVPIQGQGDWQVDFSDVPALVTGVTDVINPTPSSSPKPATPPPAESKEAGPDTDFPASQPAGETKPKGRRRSDS